MSDDEQMEHPMAIHAESPGVLTASPGGGGQ